MRAFTASLAAAVLALVACAGQQRPMPERAAAFGHPEPDPACRVRVADALRLAALETVAVNVALRKDGAALVGLGPGLTPSQAEDLRRAFPECTWRPGEDGATTGTVVFSLP
jgi:hypothetical protein